MYGDSGVEFAHDLVLDAALRENERAYLGALTRRLEGVTRATLTSSFLEGPVAEAIAEQARSQGAGLVVMTTHGRGPLARFWLGSVADQLVRCSAVPVLLVRPREPAPEPSARPTFSKILIPLDGSELAERILGPAVELGRMTDAEYRLLRVVEPVVVPNAGYDSTLIDRLEEEARAYLARVEERLRGRSLRVQTRVVVGCPAAPAVLDVAASDGVDLIALETHGRGGLGRLLLGSVADKLIRGAAVPVLVHRPGPRKEGKS